MKANAFATKIEEPHSVKTRCSEDFLLVGGQQLPMVLRNDGS